MLPPFSSSMKYMLPSLSNWMPSCEVRGIDVLVHEVRAVIARRRQRIEDARRASIGFLQLEQPAVRAGAIRCALVHQLSSAGDERAPGRPVARHRTRRGAAESGLCQIVSVCPVCRSWRWTPDLPVSKTVNR